jgi:branched-chain amino acid aminotransferase
MLHHRHRGGGDPVAEIGQCRFAIGDITRNLMNDYTALVQPARAVAAAG